MTTTPETKSAMRFFLVVSALFGLLLPSVLIKYPITSSSWSTKTMMGSAATSPSLMMVDSYAYDMEERMDSMMGVDDTSSDTRIARTTNMVMTVDDVSEAVTDISTLVTSLDGYVVSSALSNDDVTTSASMTLRVPYAHADTLHQGILDIGTFLESEQTSRSDETNTFIDLEARLTALQAEEKSYLAILEEATSVEDILAVESYLARVRTNIEQITAQITSIERVTNFATLYVTLSEEAGVLNAGQDNFSLRRDANTALALVITLGQHLLRALTYVAIFAVLIGLPVLLVFALFHLIIRLRSARSPRKRR